MPEPVKDEIERLATAVAEDYGLTKFQRDAVENIMYRTANAVLLAQEAEREDVAREICDRLTSSTEIVTPQGFPYPVKDFVVDKETRRGQATR